MKKILVFSCLQLIKISRHHCADQTKHVFRQRWPFDLRLTTSLYTMKEIVRQRSFHLLYEGIQEYFRASCLEICPLFKKKSDPEFVKVHSFRTTGYRSRIWIIGGGSSRDFAFFVHVLDGRREVWLGLELAGNLLLI